MAIACVDTFMVLQVYDLYTSVAGKDGSRSLQADSCKCIGVSASGVDGRCMHRCVGWFGRSGAQQERNSFMGEERRADLSRMFLVPEANGGVRNTYRMQRA